MRETYYALRRKKRAETILRSLSVTQLDLLVSVYYRTRQTARAPTLNALREAGLIRRGDHGKDPGLSLSWEVTALGRIAADIIAPRAAREELEGRER